MAPAVKPFQAIAERYKFMPGHARVVSCISGTTFDTGQAAGLLSRQIARPVEWVRTVRTLRAAGVTRFDEVNGETLTRLLTDIH
jgi:malonyl CoA-acyl carrier protein transacylase